MTDVTHRWNGKQIRYWIVGGSAQAEFGQLMASDDAGIMVRDDSGGEHFFPWRVLAQLSFHEVDQHEPEKCCGSFEPNMAVPNSCNQCGEEQRFHHAV